jgi:hypothetical protein
VQVVAGNGTELAPHEVTWIKVTWAQLGTEKNDRTAISVTKRGSRNSNVIELISLLVLRLPEYSLPYSRKVEYSIIPLSDLLLGRPS